MVITIPLQDYVDAIRHAGYYQGLAEGLEKQLEGLKGPVEIDTISPADLIKKV